MSSHGSAPPLSSVVATEKGLIEQPAIELFQQLGWATANFQNEEVGPGNAYGRLSRQEVFLPIPLRAAVQVLNPALPSSALTEALMELTRDRSAMLPEAANRNIYRLLRDGVPVEVLQANGSKKPERVRLIDWQNPNANNFFLASQFWIATEVYTRRPDLVGFVNGIPLLMVELKAPQENVAEAYEKNLRDYRDTIPALFHPNGFVLLSNGLKALMGPSHAPFEEFSPWRRMAEDEAADRTDLELMLRATCQPARFLDLIESFLLFREARGGLTKVVGKYHQVLGVNRALEAVRNLEENQGRLGVFWHTQGSGKSFSMVFFAEKVLRTMGSNWTFVTSMARPIAGLYPKEKEAGGLFAVYGLGVTGVPEPRFAG